MRLFIALRLSDAMCEAIGDLQRVLQRQGVRGSYTSRENLHLTLAFIGEYNDPEYVLEVLAGISFEPIDLVLEGVGAYGDLWWIGLEACQGLQDYVRKLRHALAEAGIPFDRKRFSPHITMLRRADVALSKARIPPVERVSMIADHPSLMRSDRGKAGMIYTEIR